MVGSGGVGWLVADRDTQEVVAMGLLGGVEAESEGREHGDINWREAQALRICMEAVVQIRSGETGNLVAGRHLTPEQQLTIGNVLLDCIGWWVRS